MIVLLERSLNNFRRNLLLWLRCGRRAFIVRYRDELSKSTRTRRVLHNIGTRIYIYNRKSK